MRRLLGSAGAIAAIIGASLMIAAPAQAYPGEVQNICASNLTPSGWVDVQWYNTFTCGNTFNPNAKQIKQISGLPVGTTVVACASTVPPSGWSIVSFYRTNTCAYSPYSLSSNTYTLRRTS
jgi:hypothetical protein